MQIMKKNLTEEKLIELNFKKNYVTPEESGDPEGYHYFSYELGNGECLLTQTDDETDGEFYSVEFLTIPDIGKFWDYKDVRDLIEILNRATNV